MSLLLGGNPAPPKQGNQATNIFRFNSRVITELWDFYTQIRFFHKHWHLVCLGFKCRHLHNLRSSVTVCPTSSASSCVPLHKGMTVRLVTVTVLIKAPSRSLLCALVVHTPLFSSLRMSGRHTSQSPRVSGDGSYRLNRTFGACTCISVCLPWVVFCVTDILPSTGSAVYIHPGADSGWYLTGTAALEAAIILLVVLNLKQTVEPHSQRFFTEAQWKWQRVRRVETIVA